MAVSYLGSETDQRIVRQILNDLTASPPKLISADIETVSLKDRTIRGIGIATPDNHAFYFDVWDKDLPWHLFVIPQTWVIWHNAPFDLSKESMGLYGINLDNIHDSVILTRMMPDIDNSLEFASQYVHTTTRNMGDVMREHNAKDTYGLPWNVLAEKCQRDALATMQIFLKFKPMVSAEYYEQERLFLIKLLKMSHKGIKLDHQRVVEIDRELEADLIFYMGKARSLGFNPLSFEQVAIVLNDRGHFLKPNRTTGRPDTSIDSIGDINDPVAQLIILCRKYSKLHNTYTHKWLDQDRSYTHYRMDGNTGRTSSVDENHQNLPTGKRKGDIVPRAGTIRSVFIPDSDWGTKWDLEQLELRVLAHLSQDKEMIRIFNTPGADLHGETQAAMKIQSRVEAKNVNFGMIFGGSNEVLLQFTGQKDTAYLDMLRLRWAEKFPQAWGYIEDQKKEAKRTLRVESLYGRVMNISDSHKALTEKHIENCGINWPIQSTGVEIFKRIVNASGIPTGNMLAQQHDEMWLDDKWELSEELEHIAPFWTPIKTEYVRRFG